MMDGDGKEIKLPLLRCYFVREGSKAADVFLRMVKGKARNGQVMFVSDEEMRSLGEDVIGVAVGGEQTTD